MVLAGIEMTLRRRTPQEEILKRTGPSTEQWAQHANDDDITLGQTLILAKEEL